MPIQKKFPTPSLTDSDNIWNFDETGFRIGIRRDQLVITNQQQQRQLYLGHPKSTELLQSMRDLSRTRLAEKMRSKRSRYSRRSLQFRAAKMDERIVWEAEERVTQERTIWYLFLFLFVFR